MTARSRISTTLLLALSAAAATGFAYRTSQAPATEGSAPGAATPTVMPAAHERSTAPAASVEHVLPAVFELYAAPVPAYRTEAYETGAYQTEPPVTVTAPRPSEDELLRNVVMDRLSADAYLSGRIGVESHRHTVSLTGRVGTTGQAERAGMIARGVAGVRNVNNYLLARVGMS